MDATTGAKPVMRAAAAAAADTEAAAAPRLRRIAALRLPDITPPAELGTRPELAWVAPAALFVDETYQREFSHRGRALVRRIAAGFNWARYKPPVVVRDRHDGAVVFHVIDGQHTAVAAASIGIKSLPVFVVGADTLVDRARAFVGHNTDRIGVPTWSRFKALLAAGDEDACDIANVCARAGVRLRVFGRDSVVAEGDCMAVGRIGRMIKRAGVLRARVVMEALRRGGCAPIDGVQIAAGEHVMMDLHPAAPMQRLADAIRDAGTGDGFDLRGIARREKLPVYMVLGRIWAEHM